ncbi:MAG: phosphotransacetylase family protein [Chloroflexi bacterium]|nr:phosphotransacetylase family protein [Chloroflexota bacterium]
MAVLYVASEDEGAGKTTLCVTLARLIADQGRRAVVFKPLAGEGREQDSDPDVAIYGKLLGQTTEGWPVAASNRRLDAGLLGRIETVFADVSAGADAVIIEGSSALSRERTRRLVEALDARVLVVVRYRHDLSADGLTGWKQEMGELLAGVLINGCTLHMGHEARTGLLPAMESKGLISFGLVPEDRRLLGVSVRQLADHLGGRFIVCEEKADALVEHLMVGGMGMDPGEYYFRERENKAVIGRGDRPDIHMSALATPTACMVLTKGIEPIEYVKYEAEQEEVSVMVVETDTLETMDAVGSLVDRARFDHPLKLERYGELLEEHADLPGLLGLLGI